jgi:hypothetical protein
LFIIVGNFACGRFPNHPITCQTLPGFGRSGIDLFIKKNLFPQTQFLAGCALPPIPLAHASEAPGLSTKLAEAAVGTRVFLPFPTVRRLKNQTYSRNSYETMIFGRLWRFHGTPPHQFKIQILCPSRETPRL